MKKNTKTAAVFLLAAILCFVFFTACSDKGD